MGSILEKLEQAIKDLLIGWIESNLTNMFTDVNTKVGTIAGEVGQTPSTWNSSIYQMIRGLSENVIVPIAGIIITFVLCYELITMITEKNNLHDMDTWMFFKWFFKAAVAIYLVTNTFDIVLAVFDIGQNVVAGAAGFIHGTTNIDIQATLDAMRTGMEAMSIGELLGLSIETLVISLCLKIMSIAKPYVALSTAAMLMVVIMLPFIFFALYEKDGQPAEKILGHVVKSMFLRDKVRPYRTNNLYAAIQRQIKEQEELQIGKQIPKGK